MLKKRGAFSKFYNQSSHSHNCSSQTQIQCPITSRKHHPSTHKNVQHHNFTQLHKNTDNNNKSTENSKDTENNNKNPSSQKYHSSHSHSIIIQQLQTENQNLKDKITNTKNNFKANIYNYQINLSSLQTQLEQLNSQLKNYENGVKHCLIWLIDGFSHLHAKPKEQFQIYYVKAFAALGQYLQHLEIENTIHQIAKQKLKKQQIDSQNITLEGLSLTEIQSLQQTFNLSQKSKQLMDHIYLSEKLFQQQQQPYSEKQKQKQQQSTVNNSGRCVEVLKNYYSSEENHLNVQSGQKISLLRKVGENLWIGEYEDKIGYINQKYLSIN